MIESCIAIHRRCSSGRSDSLSALSQWPRVLPEGVGHSGERAPLRIASDRLTILMKPPAFLRRKRKALIKRNA